MLVTYSLFIHRPGDGKRFEPFLGRSQSHAFERAEQILAEDENVHLVEVFFGDARLFSVSRSD